MMVVTQVILADTSAPTPRQLTAATMDHSRWPPTAPMPSPHRLSTCLSSWVVLCVSACWSSGKRVCLFKCPTARGGVHGLGVTRIWVEVSTGLLMGQAESGRL